MSRFTKILWLLTATLLLGLSACGGATPTVSPEGLYTQIAQTVLAQVAETAQAASPTPPVLETPTLEATNTPLISDTPLSGTPFITPLTFSTPSEATNTPLLSPTPGQGTPSATPLTIATLPPPQSASCDNAAFVTDVTFPDGAAVTPGQFFVKTWRFKNLGPCSWDRNYNLVFGWGGTGTDWANQFPVNFPALVKPGDTMDISIRLHAPTKTGGYGVYCRLQNKKGYNFGPVFALFILVK
jgi:hypothetical protein